MELKQFVKTVIMETISAVDESSSESSRNVHLASNDARRTIEFDVAVTVEEASELSGKAGIKVLQFIEGAGDGSKSNKSSTVSRIMFGVHVDASTKQEQVQQRTDFRRHQSRADDSLIYRG